MTWSLVCPASRGIGFSLTRYILQNTQLPVIATCRRDAAENKLRILKDLDTVDPERLTVLNVDLTDEATMSDAAARARSLFPAVSHHLQLAFCLPGILYPEKCPAQIQLAQLTETFATNTIGPLLLFKHFSSFLPGKKLTRTTEHAAVWLNMSARVGSTSDNSLGGWYSYRASKAALNSITKTEDLYLQSRCGEKAMTMSYHPGTVKTDLSKDFWAGVPKEKLFSPEFAVKKMWQVVHSVGLAGRGKCFDWKGDIIMP